MKPQCKKCGRRGQLDEDLCAICYKQKTGKWSKKFTADYGKGKGAK